MTDENWISFEPGELIVFEEGKKIFSSKNIDSALSVLGVLRGKEHKVPLVTIMNESIFFYDLVIAAIDILKSTGIINQDCQDEVDWNHELATYYTIRKYRLDIDQVLATR